MSEPPPHNTRILQRACDGCKTRKIRCDKLFPCSACKSSFTPCRMSTTRGKEPPTRSRVLITKEYERKIDRIHERLAGIEAYLPSVLQQFDAIPSKRETQQNVIKSLDTTSTTPVPSMALTDRFLTLEAFDATPNTHSVLAGHTIDRAMEENPMIGQDPALADALRSLRFLQQNTSKDPSTADFKVTTQARSDSARAASPSRIEIYDTLRKAEGCLMLKFCPRQSITDLMQRCQDFFNKANDSGGPVDRALVYGMLYILCVEYGENDTDPFLAERYAAVAQSFRIKLERAIFDLPLVITPSMHAIMALMISVAVAVNLCKPYLALHLTSMAASMVLSLGYNRFSSMQGDTDHTKEQKLHLFWMVYIFDTSFSVRLGRLPLLRAHDIAVPLLADDGTMAREIVHIIRYWIDLGSIQCQVVEHLYTQSARHLPMEDRCKRAADLSVRLQEIWDARTQVSLDEILKNYSTSSLALIGQSDAIIHFSTLALIQHAADTTGNKDSPACDAARLALWHSIEVRLNNEEMAESVWNIHCHWALLNAPFTPVTVIFCHIIADPANSEPDLCLLRDFVANLKSLSHLSDGVANLHHSCDTFLSFAELYSQHKARLAAGLETTERHDPGSSAPQPDLCEVDEYLQALGFIQPSGFNDGQSWVHHEVANKTYLDDWFHGNSMLVGPSGGNSDLHNGRQGQEYVLDTDIA